MTQGNKPVSKRLFVGSLPYRMTEGELLSLFVTEGKIISLRIIHNQWGKSRGMGYVEYEREEDAIRAKNKYHNFRVGDRSIIVDYAQPDPFLTPEGKARHQEAQVKKGKKGLNRFDHNTQREFNPERFKNTSNPDSDKFFGQTGFKPRRKFSNQDSKEKPERRFKSKKHVRQSVFESRNFGSKIGAKFASRNKSKKNK